MTAGAPIFISILSCDSRTSNKSRSADSSAVAREPVNKDSASTKKTSGIIAALPDCSVLKLLEELLELEELDELELLEGQSELLLDEGKSKPPEDELLDDELLMRNAPRIIQSR